VIDRTPSFEWGAVSDVGQVRAANEDSHLARDGLFVVADGMGGHSGGEVASAVAVDLMGSLAEPSDIFALVDQVCQANDAVLARADGQPDLAGMGTTLCAVARLAPETDAGLGLVNVGDSRIYLYVDEVLTQVSEDHSLVQTLIREGQLSPEEAANHPQRNVVTRALGIADDISIDYWELEARTGVRLLLCSDGLVGEVDDDAIAGVLADGDPPQAAAERLVELANRNGGHDNITVVVVDVTGGVEVDVDPPGPPRTSRGDDRLVDKRSLDHTPALGTSVISPAPPVDRSPLDRLSRPRLSALAGGAAVVLLVALILVGRYARDNYYVTFDNAPEADVEQTEGRSDERQVSLFQGRPGGVLWFGPTIEERAAIVERDLTDALVLEIEGVPEFDSLDDARAYIVGLGDRIEGAAVAE